MKLYRSFREEVPDEAYEVPLDKAAVTREGTDVSIITYGAMVREAIKATDSLAKDNISAEIIDLRTVAPLDVETIINSVENWPCGCRSSTKQAGVGAMVVSEISERAVLSLEAPIGRVSAQIQSSHSDKQKISGYQMRKISKQKLENRRILIVIRSR